MDKQNQLQPASAAIAAEIEKLSRLSASSSKTIEVCDICFGSGFEYVTRDRGRGCQPCRCRLDRIREAGLAAIPAEFGKLRLADLAADNNRHPRQAAAIASIRSNPLGSYFIAGRFGSGKTMLAWALYREALDAGRKVVFATLNELLDEYKKAIVKSRSGEERIFPRIEPADLRQAETKYAIFLDDIDKARPSEYVAEQLFELVNAVWAYDHQLVVTTNLSVAKLLEHFNRADERYGGAIVRRIVEKATRLDLFDDTGAETGSI